MTAEPPSDSPRAPDIDENGVDREQIRAMLRLTPEQRLRLVEEFVESALEFRERNAPLPALIEAKERAGRPKDLAALPVLRATLDELKRRS